MNKIEEVKIATKFPMYHSFLNLNGVIYLSGGKINGKDSNLVQKISRTGEKSFQIDNIANLQEARTHHCSIYIKKTNSIYFISGSKKKSCEKYNLTKGKMENFPALKVSREKCCACLLDEKYLYVFFGFDKTKNKFETTIEKIFINNALSWELITLQGNQNMLKKQSFACIPYNYEDKKGVIITGGINSLRNETKETVYFNYETKKADTFNNSLPVDCSFTNSYYVGFGEKYSIENEIVNISNEFTIVKFNKDTMTFSGI